MMYVVVCVYNINIIWVYNREGFFTCVYCYHIIITFCYKISKIQEKNCKISDYSSIWLVK